MKIYRNCQDPVSTKSQQYEWILIAAIILLAAGIRFYRIGSMELWEDEAASWFFSQQILKTDYDNFAQFEATPPLYYSLLSVVLLITPDSEADLRFPSVIAGIISIWWVYLLIRKMFGFRAAIVGMLLASVHPLHVFYSREARSYPFLLMFVLWYVWHSLRASEKDGWNLDHAGMLISGLFSGFCHYFGLIAVTTTLFITFITSKKRNQWFRNVAVILVIIVFFLFYAAMFFTSMQEDGGTWTISFWLKSVPQEYNIFRILSILFFASNYHEHLRYLDIQNFPLWFMVTAYTVQIGLLLGSVLRLFDRRLYPFVLLMWSLYITLITGPWVLSLIWKPVYIPGRHDIAAIGPLVILLSIGFDHWYCWMRRKIEIGRIRIDSIFRSVSVVLILSVFILSGMFRILDIWDSGRFRFHSLAGEYIARNAEDRDVVYAMGIRKLVTEYYMQRHQCKIPIRSFPASTDLHPGWANIEDLVLDQESLYREGVRIARDLHDPETERTIWILGHDYPSEGTRVTGVFAVDRMLWLGLESEGWIRDSLRENDTTRFLNIFPYIYPKK